MSVHGVLIQTQQEIQLIPVAVDLLIAGTHGEKNMPASDDRLIGVVRVEVETAADKNPRQNIAGRGDSVSGGTTNREGKSKLFPRKSPSDRLRKIRTAFGDHLLVEL